MTSDEVVGRLGARSSYSVEVEQQAAWRSQTELLKTTLAGLVGHLILEFDIPRMGHRVDAIVIVDSAIFVTEFKVGADTFDPSAVEQVWDYVLDLKNFHRASHELTLFPILIATEAASAPTQAYHRDDDGVVTPLCATAEGLRRLIDDLLPRASGSPFVHAEDRRNYLKNAYRVLLTRARQGMVIFVPPGDKDDATRPPGFYDETFRYLSGIGLPSIEVGWSTSV